MLLDLGVCVTQSQNKIVFFRCLIAFSVWQNEDGADKLRQVVRDSIIRYQIKPRLVSQQRYK